MSYSNFLLLIVLLFQSTFQAPCKYKETDGQTTPSETSDTYLDSISGSEAKKQKCFSLSHSDFFTNQCCYYKDPNNKEICLEKDATTGIVCPEDTKIPNNCGMAGIYQPKDPSICTEISLVSGYCCYVKTNDQGTFCGSRDEMDDDNKNEVPEDVREYVTKYINSLSNKEGYGSTKVESIICQGYNLKYYGVLILLATMFLF